MYNLFTVHISWWLGGCMYSLYGLISVIPMAVFPVCRYDGTIIPAYDLYSIIYIIYIYLIVCVLFICWSEL